MKDNALLFGTLFDQPSLFIRLKIEFAEASREFRSNPGGFVTGVLSGTAAGGARRRVLMRFGLATGIVFYAVVFAAILIFWTVSHRLSQATELPDRDKSTKLTWMSFPRGVDRPKDRKDSAGGGGGGDDSTTPPSQGLPPTPSLAEQLIAPTPEPQLKAPALPVDEIIPVDPRFNLRPDLLAPTGLQDGAPGPPNAGPGSDRGMGSGEKGGMGSGGGRGFGPGNGWNCCGPGNPSVGGDSHSFASEQQRVDQGPVALNRPRPNYTEQARKEKIQGIVLARALVGADGVVRQVVIRRSLPAGLDAEAIQAVNQMRFRPAMRNGQPVATWISLEVEFNLR